MKQIAIVLAVLLCSLPTAADHLTFAPLPMETPYTVASQWKPFLDYLENELRHDLNIDYSKTNDEVVDKFKKEQVDLAYLGPLPYITLKKEYPQAEPIIVFHEKTGHPFYHCVIVVAAESNLDAGDIKGKRLGMTQPLSTCGYFAVSGMLEQAGSSVEANRFRYLGPHDEVALSVVRGEFAAGGLKGAIARKYSHLGLKIIAKSPPMPGLALVANSKTLSREQIEQIRSAILNSSSAIRKTWGDNIRHGVSPASDAIYDALRQIPLRSQFPSQGNF